VKEDLVGANELSAQLWRQRELLELLLFKYEEERLLLAAGKTRWIPQATREIEKVVERLKEASLSLSVALVDVAKVWQLPDGALLRDVVNAAPELMWRDIFNEHLNALIGLITEIRGIRSGNVHLVRSALDQARGTIGDPVAPVTYSAAGRPDYTVPVARLIDESL
jgi:hypothetical protein